MTNKIMLECLECYAQMFGAIDKGIRALEQGLTFEKTLLNKEGGVVPDDCDSPSDISK